MENLLTPEANQWVSVDPLFKQGESDMYLYINYDGKHVHVKHSKRRYDARFLANSEEDASKLVCSLNLPAKLAELAAHRYSIETGDMSVGELTVRMDRESQFQLNSAYITLKEGFLSSTRWKGVGGWQTVTLETIEPLARLVAAHVDRCFNIEEQVELQLRAITDHEELAAADPTVLFDGLFRQT